MSHLPAALLAWFRTHRRELPWRSRRDPWTTWVSEVMLQQTTVEVVAPRFESFLRRFPDVAALARARETEVTAAWAGLGYYRRARALHRGAAEVVSRHGGRIPEDEAALLELPGIGPYTAGAIRAFAFGRRAAAVDGNVARVLARILADDGDIASAAVRARLAARALAWTPEHGAGDFAEALIELGALVCRPKEPRCGECPVRGHCRAAAGGRPEAWPVRRERKPAIAVDSVRAIVRDRGRLLLVLRPDGASLLPGFLELPGRWGPPGEDPLSVIREVLRGIGLRPAGAGRLAGEARHTITRHRIRSLAYVVDVRGRLQPPGRWHEEAGLDRGSVTTETRKLLAAEARA